MEPPTVNQVRSRPYHHGDLRRALLAAAIDEIARSGPSDLSLRDLARQAGVSHAASTHHFGDKRGLLTAIATDGYRLLADELAEAWERTGSFLEVGVAYVSFAVRQRAHFEVMFRPELYRPDDQALAAARAASAAVLYQGVETVRPGDPDFDRSRAGIAAWALAHGLATLWLNRVLPASLGDDPEAVARAVLAHLF